METTAAPDEPADLQLLARLGEVQRELGALEITLPLASPQRLWAILFVTMLPIFMSVGSLFFLLKSAPLWLLLAGLGLTGLIVVLVMLPFRMLVRRAQLRLRLTEQQLELGRRQFALEDIAGVTFRTGVGLRHRQDMLELTLRDETFSAEVSQPEAGRALVRLVRRHVARRQAALRAEGHDLAQPAKPPPSLIQLQQHSRSG